MDLTTADSVGMVALEATADSVAATAAAIVKSFRYSGIWERDRLGRLQSVSRRRAKTLAL